MIKGIDMAKPMETFVQRSQLILNGGRKKQTGSSLLTEIFVQIVKWNSAVRV